MATIHNWGPRQPLTRPGTPVLRPGTQDELIAAVRSGDHRRLRVIGSGHSFSDLAAVALGEDAAVVRIDRLHRVVAIVEFEKPSAATGPMPATVGTVTVEAGITLDALLRVLDEHGLTLVTVGAIREQTVAGAISTGTHGASIHVGSLSSLVVSLKLLRADGEVRTLRRDDPEHAELFRCAAVGLGALGIILEAELEVVRAFTVRPVSRMLTVDEFRTEGETIARAHSYARFYYFPYADRVECVTDIPVDDPPPAPNGIDRLQRWARGTVLDRYLVDGLFSAAAGIRPHTSIPHLMRRAAGTRRLGAGSIDRSWRCLSLADLPPRHVEMEWSVPLEHWRDAVAAVHRTIGPAPTAFVAGFVVSLRFVGSDGDIALSNNQGRANLAIDLLQHHALDHRPYFPTTAAVIRSAAQGLARPHWGKIFELTRGEIAALYPDFELFERTRAASDPTGMFTNPWLERVFQLETAAEGLSHGH
ncbi:FAD-binding protein [Nocardia uniformis]|uniref:FAD-binding protein n=1 Tax=Nocardia uniformis TaxID=53432 RepID=A0A849CCK4_9NOCA|nr:D-arabinono-1,4-lactone oxidase [Nocardia uniformis]NNH72759.1 FAD-binding protein [Nocardia uniformis]